MGQVSYLCPNSSTLPQPTQSEFHVPWLVVSLRTSEGNLS